MRLQNPDSHCGRHHSIKVRVKFSLHEKLSDSFFARKDKGKPPLNQCESNFSSPTSGKDNPLIFTNSTLPAEIRKIHASSQEIHFQESKISQEEEPDPLTHVVSEKDPLSVEFHRSLPDRVNRVERSWVHQDVQD